MSPKPSADKLPPQNLEAEQSVLGAILLESEAILKTIEHISEEAFYRNAHKKIYRAMIDLFDKNEVVDLVTVTDRLESANEIEAVGGASYLSMLASQTPTAANVVYHAKIVKEKALLRALLSSVSDVAGRIYEEGTNADEMLDFAESRIFQISEKRMKAAFVPLKELVKDSFKMIEELYERKELVTGVPSGFRDLDELTTGFQPGDLIIIGGRPSMGKTALSLNIAQHIGVEMREPVAIFSLEMSKRMLVMRMLCSEAQVDSNRVRRGMLGTEDWHKLTAAAGRLSDAPIFIDDSSNTSVLEMRAKARRLKREHGLSLVVVDYLQLMRGSGHAESREREISEISRSLKALAKEIDVPVIGLSQLNRGVEQRTNKMPTLADLRESGAIEQDADVIIFLYRDEIYNKRSKHKGIAEIKVAKQRNGPTATIRLTFLEQYTRFENYAGEYEYEEEGVEEVGPGSYLNS